MKKFFLYGLLLMILAVLLVYFLQSGKNKTNPAQQIANQNKASGHIACYNQLGIDIPENCRDITVVSSIKGLQNFREFTPGYSGKIKLKKGKIYRSDALGALKDNGIKKLQDLGLKTIIDLRSPTEIKEDPNKIIQGVVNHYNFPIGNDPAKLETLGISEEVVGHIKALFIAGDFKKIDQFLTDKRIDLVEMRKDRYREFATNYNDAIAKTLKTLTKSENYPVVLHCQGGKDRTGFVSAVILSILGYNRDDVIRDYLTTNLYTYEEIKKQYASNVESLTPAYGAHLSQIIASLDQVNTQYGSMEQYLTKIGITPEDQEKIRGHLLTKPMP